MEWQDEIMGKNLSVAIPTSKADGIVVGGGRVHAGIFEEKTDSIRISWNNKQVRIRLIAGLLLPCNRYIRSPEFNGGMIIAKKSQESLTWIVG